MGTWGLSSALMIVSGYYGELVVTGDLTPRWLCWFVSMGFFLYIVYELLVGLAAATNSETDPVIKGKIQTAQNHDCDQLVHLSCGLPFPHVRHQRSHCRGFHPDWLLRVRHHFQVRRWPCDLSDHLCQVQQGGPLELKKAAFLLKTSCPRVQHLFN